MIDMGPDIFTQALQYGSMCDIEHVLITHTHDDHLIYGIGTYEHGNSSSDNTGAFLFFGRGLSVH